MKFSQILDSLYDAVLDDLADRIAERVVAKVPKPDAPAFVGDHARIIITPVGPTPQKGRATSAQKNAEGAIKKAMSDAEQLVPQFIKEAATAMKKAKTKLIADEQDAPEMGNPISEPDQEDSVTYLPPDPQIGDGAQAAHCAARISALIKKHGELSKLELADELGIAFGTLGTQPKWVNGLKQAVDCGLIGQKKDGRKNVYFRREGK